MKYQIPTEVLKLNPRVFKYDINGEIVYVKKREKNKKHFGHILQSIIYKITKNPMLIPTVLSKNENEVLFEIKKILKLKKDNSYKQAFYNRRLIGVLELILNIVKSDYDLMKKKQLVNELLIDKNLRNGLKVRARETVLANLSLKKNISKNTIQ